MNSTIEVFGCTIPTQLKSELNMREHWSARAKRSKAQRDVVRLAFRRMRELTLGETAAVSIVRIGPRALDDDNLQGSAKHVRDQIAEELGRDDGPRSGISWSYSQERGPYGVRIRIEVFQ